MTPQICLGTAQFGTAYGIAGRTSPLSDAEVRDVLAVAESAGVFRLDTAPAYGDIEERFGRLLDGRHFEVVSKISVPANVTSEDAAHVVAASIETSLKRLQGNLTGLMFHDPNVLKGTRGRTIWEIASAVCEREGLTLGVSGYGPQEIEILAADFAIDSTQIPANAFDQRFAEFDGLSNIEITVRSVFLQGLLLMDPAVASAKLPQSSELMTKWVRWCQERGMSQLEVCLGIAKNLRSNFVVVGVDDQNHLEEILTIWHQVAPVDASELRTESLDVIDPRRWTVRITDR